MAVPECRRGKFRSELDRIDSLDFPAVSVRRPHNPAATLTIV
jgi:hypothetical protein